MRAGLLLIDVQNDYLDRDELAPLPLVLIERAARLLALFRVRELPVAHAHTLVRPDGANRMPHWRSRDHWACVEGTRGAEPPAELAPRDGERVFTKPFFSAWGCGDVEPYLRARAVDTLVVAGLYTHGCVRATVLDAYQAGFEVWLATDAVASYDALHAEVSLRHLADRACEVLDVDTIAARLGASASPTAATSSPALETPDAADALPVAFVAGQWLDGEDHPPQPRHSPADWSIRLARVPLARERVVTRAVAAAADAQPAWARLDPAARSGALAGWADALRRRRERLLARIIEELGKPRRDAAAELDYAVGLIDAARSELDRAAVEVIAPNVRVHHRPRTTVAVITPWNNPVALPIGKIAPALAWGNAVVWKAPIEAPRTAIELLESLLAARSPAPPVHMVFGDARTAHAILHDPRIAAVSFTGSHAAGQQVAAACALRHTPLQAELGGNNAAIVMPDCDLDRVARDIATSAFSFAGQRCTALRRVIAHRDIHAPLRDRLVHAIESLRLGPPESDATDCGPLVSRAAQHRIAALVDDAGARGGAVLCGGRVPSDTGRGCWYEPTLLTQLNPDAPVVRWESFGPVAVLLAAADLAAALDLLNGVDQGLVATLYSDDAAHQRQFLDTAEAGILRLGVAQQAVHPAAPFGGWKASGLGPPEHGTADRHFYARPQTIYHPPPP